MKTPVFSVIFLVLMSSSVALACRCISHTRAAEVYLRNCVTATSALVVSSAQSVSNIKNCQDTRLAEYWDSATGASSVVSSEIIFLEDGYTFTVMVEAVNHSAFFFDGEAVSQIVSPTVTFSQRLRCLLERLNPFGCSCACAF